MSVEVWIVELWDGTNNVTPNWLREWAFCSVSAASVYGDAARNVYLTATSAPPDVVDVNIRSLQLVSEGRKASAD